MGRLPSSREPTLGAVSRLASHRQGSNGSSREGDRAGAGGVLCSGRPHLHCLPVSVSLTHTDTHTSHKVGPWKQPAHTSPTPAPRPHAHPTLGVHSRVHSVLQRRVLRSCTSRCHQPRKPARAPCVCCLYSEGGAGLFLALRHLASLQSPSRRRAGAGTAMASIRQELCPGEGSRASAPPEWRPPHWPFQSA